MPVSVTLIVFTFGPLEIIDFNAATKCKFMIIRLGGYLLPSPTPSLCTNNTPLELVTSYRYLGIIIHQHLTWDPQINDVHLKAR